MRRFVTRSFVLGAAALVICDSITHADGTGLLKEPTLHPISATPAAAPVLPQQSAGRSALAAPGGFSRLGTASRPQLAPQPNLALTNQTRQALSFYGGQSARATLSQLPRRTPIQASGPRPRQTQRKPFAAFQADPTISPYLNLDRPETADDLPNFFVFVRPQFQQMDTNRGQQRELNHMQRQLNSVTATVVSPQQDRSKLPGTGTPSRFMDTAQFYGGWRR